MCMIDFVLDWLMENGATGGVFGSGLLLTYKLATRRDARQRARDREFDRIDEDIDDRMREVVDEHLTIIRSLVYQEAINLLNAKNTILGIEKVHFKSVQVDMSHSTLLEKIDAAIKDVISKHLVRHIVRDWRESRYHTATAEVREATIDRHSKHLRNVLWVRMSKDAGLSDILKNAYDVGVPYVMFRDIVADMYTALEVQEQMREEERDAWRKNHCN